MDQITIVFKRANHRNFIGACDDKHIRIKAPANS